MGNKDLNTAMVLWSKAVDTQMHFNEMSHKSRQLGISFSVATLGICVGVYSTNSFEFANLTRADACGILMLIASFGMFAVGWLELRLYQRLLVGAVRFGEMLESNGFGEALPPGGKGMTTHISIAANDLSWDGKTRKSTSQRAIWIFYLVSVLVLVVSAGLLLIFQKESKISPNPGTYLAVVVVLYIVGFVTSHPPHPEPPDHANAEQAEQKKAA